MAMILSRIWKRVLPAGMSGGSFGQVMAILERLKRSCGDIDLWGFLGEVYLREEQLFLAYEHMSYYIENCSDEIDPGYAAKFEDLVPVYENIYGQVVGATGLGMAEERGLFPSR